MSLDNEKLQHVIEQICANGCEHVNDVIVVLERNGSIEQTRELSDTECNLVLQELKAIMAVYQQK